jgi:Mrp family chromosome partitioning ATPase
MHDLILQAQERYDLVVIDTPATTVVADALLLVRDVEAVVIVSRLHRNSRDSAGWVREQLSDLNARALGVVLNGAKPPGFNHRRSLRLRAPVRSSSP